MTGIKAATLNEVPVITGLANKIWPQVYGYMISTSQIDYMLKLMYNETVLANQIKEGHNFVIYYDNEIPLGFAGFAPESETSVYKLHKLYLDPSLQGNGIGLLLLNYVIVNAKIAGAKTLRLNVNKNNKTLSFYKKYGFKIVKEVVVDIAGGFVMDDYVMERELI